MNQDQSSARCLDADERFRLDQLARIYAGIQEHIRFADSKAGFVAAINALLLGFIASNYGTIRSVYTATHNWNYAAWLSLLMIIPAVPTAISVVYVLWAVMPRFGADTHSSKVFFNHIADGFKRDGAKYRDQVVKMAVGDWICDYGNQIVESASIAKEKHGNVKKAVIAASTAFILLAVTTSAVQIVSLVIDPTPTAASTRGR